MKEPKLLFPNEIFNWRALYKHTSMMPTPDQIIEQMRRLKVSQIRKQLKEDYESPDDFANERYVTLVTFISLASTQHVE